MLLRRALTAALVLAAGVALAARPDDKALLPDGNYLLSTVSGTGDRVLCLLKVETKDGKPTASVVATPLKGEVTVTEFKTAGKDVTVTVQLKQSFSGREFTSQQTFTGTVGDPKTVLGTTGSERSPQRAKLTATDKAKLDKADAFARTPASEALSKVLQLNNKAYTLQFKAQQTKDADERKDLMKQMAEARKEAIEKSPAMYREVVAKHPGTPAAADAAMSLIRSASTAKLTADEATKLVAAIRKDALPYGPRYSNAVLSQAAEVLVRQKDLGAAALAAIEPAARALSPTAPPETQVKVLTTYKAALANAGKAETAKALEPRLMKLEKALDDEYLQKVPPFKPAKYAGRKEPGANRVAVLELFTGAQCPPCVAADVAFDALMKSYPPTDVVLLQYHMHIPGPDPMTNPDTIARWDHYREKFPSVMRGVPSTVFNGKPQAGGGGAMANAEKKFEQYRGILDKALEESTDVKLAGTAKRDGNTVTATVELTGMKEPKKGTALRLILVEETIRYAGGNGVRFHHHVVRSLFDKPKGVPLSDLKDGKHTARVDLSTLRTDLTKYLTEFEKDRPFSNPTKPLDLKHLKVVALVQDDETGEILQAAQFDVGG
jgi:hypothetical protein